MTWPRRGLTQLVVGLVTLCGCSVVTPSGTGPVAAPSDTMVMPVPSAPMPSPSSPAGTAPGPLPGMPPLLDPADVYAADRAGALSPVVAHDPYRVYVPNSGSNTVTIIDPRTYRALRTTSVGRQPQHVVPAWDLRTLWVNNDLGNSLTPIDPVTTRQGAAVAVADPYNLYFTPDGQHAVVMASKLRRIDFRDPHTMRLQRSVPVPCQGVNHADWTADGRFFLVSCEFSGDLLWVDTASERVAATIHLDGMSMPQDVKLSPDGRSFYVADMMAGGIWQLGTSTGTPVVLRLIRTGRGAHGLFISRDSRSMYVSNRDAGTVSTVDLSTSAVTTTWSLPPGSSPDMGGISPDGQVLWLSGRYDHEVYAIATRDGRLLARIQVGSGPHGLCVWPQPGRYSLGHTGILR